MTKKQQQYIAIGESQISSCPGADAQVVFCGVHDASNSYEQYSIIMHPQLSCYCMANSAIPENTPINLGQGEGYWRKIKPEFYTQLPKTIKQYTEYPFGLPLINSRMPQAILKMYAEPINTLPQRISNVLHNLL